jgi:glutathione S-transferase
VRAKLYVIPGSHPCDCAEAALRVKQIQYDRVDLIPVVHKLMVRARFDGNTVPALVLDGERLVGSGKILERIDELVPEPPLLPRDPELRARAQDAAAWGDAVLQPLARRVAWAGLRRDHRAMMSYGQGSRLGLPLPLLRLGAGPVTAIATRLNHAGDERVEADLRALPDHLDQVDTWIGEGVLGGDPPNVADLQIGSSLRLLRTFEDVRPLIDGRPCERLAAQAFPPTVGSIPAGTYPRAWVASGG